MAIVFGMTWLSFLPILVGIGIKLMQVGDIDCNGCLDEVLFSSEK